jgi:hypothetical protein
VSVTNGRNARIKSGEYAVKKISFGSLPLCAMLLAVLAARAGAATVTLKPVVVPGGTSPVVSVISASGVLGGTYWNTAQNSVLGFVLSGSVVTILPKAVEGNIGTAVVPAGFGPNKSVVGYNDYLGSYSGLIFEPNIGYISNFPAGQAPPGPGMAVNAKGVIVLDSPTGSGGFQYFFGTVGENGLSNRLTLDPSSYLVGINNAGLMSGSYNPGKPSVFTVNANNIVTTYSVPGSAASYGGFLNNYGQLAGTYKDTNGVLHGFIEKAGVYTTFDAPVAVSAMGVQGFSDPRTVNKVLIPPYVAGVYTDQSGIQSAFLYHNGSFVRIPLPAGGTSATVIGVSKVGHVALNVGSSSGTTSYIAVCSGTGC